MPQKSTLNCNPAATGGQKMSVESGPKTEQVLDTEIVRAAVETANGQIALFTHRFSRDFEAAAAAALEDEEECELDDTFLYDSI
jgi:hypothetical protein